MLSIGIIDQYIGNWTASLTYTKMLIHSLNKVCRENNVPLSVLSQNTDFEVPDDCGSVSVIPYQYSVYAKTLPGEQKMRRLLHLPEKSKPFFGESWVRRSARLPAYGEPVSLAALRHNVSVLLPVRGGVVRSPHVRTLGWIPDFQHVHLPEFFSDAERGSWDDMFRQTAQTNDLVMLSSNSASQDFQEHLSEYSHKSRTVPFPSLFAFEALPEKASSAHERFCLPEKFALVTNQFWKHKNHRVVVDAVAQLKKQGMRIPVVMTGLPSDWRDPRNPIISELLQTIASHDLYQQVIILGQIPFTELISLMRTAAVVIQPSRFEGWSTVVQDAKALGRPIICSDISVHREQAPSALGFFDCHDSDALAQLLDRHWASLSPGPDFESEQSALYQEKIFAREHGQKLLEICQTLIAS